MKDVIFLLFNLLTTLAKLLQPGGSRAVIAEKLHGNNGPSTSIKVTISIGAQLDIYSALCNLGA